MAFDAGPRGKILAELGGGGAAGPIDMYGERTPPFLGLGNNNYTSDLTPEGRRSSDYFRGILNSLGASPDVDLFFTPQSNSPNAFAGSIDLTSPYQRDTVIVQGDARNAYGPDELKNILAHELNHLKYNHSGRKAEIDNQLNLNPQKMSGTTFLPWTEKRWENEADLGGQRDYLNSGGDPSLFLREGGAIQPKGPSHPPFSNLSPQDTHYNDTYRNQILRQGLMSWLTSGSNAQTLSELAKTLKQTPAQSSTKTLIQSQPIGEITALRQQITNLKKQNPSLTSDVYISPERGYDMAQSGKTQTEIGLGNYKSSPEALLLGLLHEQAHGDLGHSEGIMHLIDNPLRWGGYVAPITNIFGTKQSEFNADKQANRLFNQSNIPFYNKLSAAQEAWGPGSQISTGPGEEGYVFLNARSDHPSNIDRYTTLMNSLISHEAGRRDLSKLTKTFKSRGR